MEPTLQELLNNIEKCFQEFDKKIHITKEQEWVDLDLPSGTLWASENEEGYYASDIAIATFKNDLPSKADWEELIDNTWHRWDKNLKGMWFCSLVDNNKKIFLPAKGYYDGANINDINRCGNYWSSTCSSSDYIYGVYFVSSGLGISDIGNHWHYGHSIRLIKK